MIILKAWAYPRLKSLRRLWLLCILLEHIPNCYFYIDAYLLDFTHNFEQGLKKNILKENEDETISFLTTQYYHLFFLSSVVRNISKKLFNVEHNLISWVDIYFILLIHFWIEAVKCLWAYYWSSSKSVTICKIIDVLWISSSTVKFCKVTLSLTKLMISSKISQVEYNLLKFHEV